MINLLPPNDKRQIRAGQSNVLLLRYCIISLLLAIPLFGLVGGVYFLMEGSRDTATTTINESNAKIEDFSEIQQQATDFQKNLTIAKEVLNREIRYSRVMVAIAKALPNNVCLDRLDLSSEMFGNPIEITASGKRYQDSLVFKTQLEKAEDIFENVHLISVIKPDENDPEQSDSSETNVPPCNPDRAVTMSISVTVKPEVSEL